VKKTETDNMAISVETIDYGYFDSSWKCSYLPMWYRKNIRNSCFRRNRMSMF